MRKLLSLVLVAISMFIVELEQPALAAEIVDGAKIFSAKCASCHIGGGNIIIAHKTLKKPALEKYSMNSMEAIVYQVKDGKNAMPAFKGRLNDEQIEAVAAYVLEQAEKGW